MSHELFVVRNEAQRILFTEELSGQISDGMWENVPGDHWKPWCDAEVVVGENVGRTFYARRRYNFTNKDLLEVVGDRMLKSVQAVIPTYTHADMMRDLKDLKLISQTSTRPTPAQQTMIDNRRATEESARRAREAQVEKEVELINTLAKDVGMTMHASKYNSRVEVSRGDLIELLAGYKKWSQS